MVRIFEEFMRAVVFKLSFLALLAGLVFFAGCGDKPPVTQQQRSFAVAQDYAPRYLDILWVIDARSPLWNNKTDLVNRATEFFQRLAQNSSNLSYRMAFITPDMQYAKGKLQPD